MAARAHQESGLSGPADLGIAITPDDNTDLVTNTRGLFVGTTGNVSVIFAADAAGTAVLLKNVPSGTLLPICVRRVRSALTTATDIVGLY
jgi:hypothetical protein